MRRGKGTVRVKSTALTAAAALCLGTAAAFAVASPAAAQDYRFGAGWYVGGSWISPLNGGATGQAEDIKFDIGWLAGVQFEGWIDTGRLGVRLNGALSERPLSTPDGKRDIGMWLLDADLLLRFLPAVPGRKVNVFLSAGAGLARYSLGRGNAVVWESADASYDGNPKARLAFTGGLGVDALTALTWDDEPIGVRFEVVDHLLLDSPFASISGGDFDPIHNVRFVISLFTGFGVRR